MGFNREKLRAISKSAGITVNGTNDATADILDEDTTQGTIGDNFVRHVYRLSLSNQNNSPVLVTIYAGYGAPGGGTCLNTKKGAWKIPAYSTLIVGEDIETPILIIRPDTSGATTADNRLYGIVDANDMEVVLDYFDEEA